MNRLVVGNSFGEMALLNSKPRNATISCVEPCAFAIVNKEDYKAILERAEIKKVSDKVKFL